MTKCDDVLIEILTEELPPKSLSLLSRAFCDNVASALDDSHFSYATIKPLASPRRLAIFIAEVAEFQPDQLIERKGPAVKAAFDQSGNPTKACLGFAASCNVKPADLKTVESDKGAWLSFTKKETGKNIQALLPEFISKALTRLPVAKKMRWGDKKSEFVRPVHGVVMLYGSSVIPGAVLGVESGNVTLGHRFHCQRPLTLTSARHYEKKLEEAFVIADTDKRKARMREQIAALEKRGKIQARVSENLLDEVNSLVEWPVALLCDYNPDFLRVPSEALISAMQDHQKSFPVTNAEGDLQPHFITISNIDSKDKAQVIKGNERVMDARLSDAAFFYQVDLKVSLESRLEKLKTVVYQEKLGTLYDKTKRLDVLSGKIAARLDVDVLQAKRAAGLAKCDLASDMVFEFPDLQGIMGAHYARYEGESEAIAHAISEHYRPKFSGDSLPDQPIACVLSLADRLDNLVGHFGIHQLPTGDKDPFALRRAALGVIRILFEKRYVLDLTLLIQDAMDTYTQSLPNKTLMEQLLAFINDRQCVWHKEKGITPDVWSSVDVLGLTEVTDIANRLQAVQTFKALDASASLAAANKRVSNILAKQTASFDGLLPDAALFEGENEKQLAIKLQEKQKDIEPLYQQKRYSDVLTQLADLKNPVDNFFDHVLVMTDNEAVRQNRLILLNQLRQLFLKVADVALLQ